MAPPWRAPYDYLFGTLTTAISNTDTTITCSAFTVLPNTYLTNFLYLPLELHNPATGVREIVWVTAHTTSSTSVTVVRGKEGTSAVAWPAGSQIICAPTASRDALGSNNNTSLATITDAHLGWRTINTDTSVTLEQTYLAGLQPSVGVANYYDVGPNRAGSNPPAGAAIITRSGFFSGTPGAGGLLPVSFRTAFPNACLTVVVSNADYTIWNGLLTPYGETASGFTAVSTNTGTSLTPNSTVAIKGNYIALGY